MKLIISNQTISTNNGLFSLNDLHKVSGGARKHQPSNFMRNAETQELIREIELEKSNSSNVMSIAYTTIEGKKGGTFVCRELVYRYAMWISPKFSLMVIRAFDALNTGAIPCLARTTTDDRTPLRQAVSMLVGKRGLDYSTAYTLVNQYMGTEHIDEIAFDDLPKAVAYVHSLMLNNMASDRLISNAQHLAWHTEFIYSWYKAIEEPFRALSPRLSAQIHDHIIHAKIAGMGISKTVGFGGLNPAVIDKQVWSVGFDGLRF